MSIEYFVKNFFAKQPCCGDKKFDIDFDFVSMKDAPVVRDEIVVENGVSKYLFWGRKLASLDGDLLYVDNLQHRSGTGQRLSAIRNYILDHFFPSWGDESCGQVFINSQGYFVDVDRGVFKAGLFPYPVTINIKTGMAVGFDKEALFYLLRHSRKGLESLLEAAKAYNIKIPEDLQLLVAKKLMRKELVAA